MNNNHEIDRYRLLHHNEKEKNKELRIENKELREALEQFNQEESNQQETKHKLFKLSIEHIIVLEEIKKQFIVLDNENYKLKEELNHYTNK